MLDKILVVDDSEINREILREIFKDTYEVLEASNGKQALHALLNEPSIKMILLDLLMPEMTGFEFLEILNNNGIIKKVPVIIITGDYQVESEKNAYNLGASDVIFKPFNAEIARKRVSNAIELYEHKNNLERRVYEQTMQIKAQAEILKHTNDLLIETLSTVVEFRNLESGQHIKNIKKVVEILLKYLKRDFPEYNLSIKECEDIVTASAMHDIGKIAISDTILLKPGKLTEDEFETMKQHTVMGCEILDRFKFITDEGLYKLIYDICRHHHEKYDGKGYPDGLVGEDIPIWSQVVSVADVYEALVSKRVYKGAFTHEEAIDMIKRGDCGTFSPKMISCLDNAQEELKQYILARED